MGWRWMAQTSLLTPQRVASWKEARFNPIRYLTPETLSQHLSSFDAGIFEFSAQVFQELMERDGMICTVSSKRKMKAGCFGWEIAKRPDADDETFEAHRAVLKYCYDNLIVTEALDQDKRRGIQGLFEDMNLAQGMKWQNFELLARPDATTGGLTFTIVTVPLWFFENRTGKMRFLPAQGVYDGEDMDPNRWMIVRGLGLMKPTSIEYIYAWIASRDWLFYTEAHSCPAVVGTTMAAHGTDAYEAFRDAIAQTLGPNAKYVINPQDKIEIVPMGSTGTLPYPEFIEKHHKLITQIWMGGEMGTMAVGQAQVGSSNQAEDSKCVEDHDAQGITEALNFNIDKKVIEYHFGPGVQPAAYICVKPKRQPDTNALTSKFRFAEEMGIPVGQDAVREALNIPKPEEGEELISKPEPPANPAFNSRAANAVKGVMEKLQQTSIERLADESANAYEPLKDRLMGIVEVYEKLGGGEVGEQAAKVAIQKLKTEWPQVLAAMNQASEGKIIALENMQAPAFLNGFLESLVKTAA